MLYRFVQYNVWLSLALCISGITGSAGLAHDGPDPIGHWFLDHHNIDGLTLKARLGPDGRFSVTPKIVPDELGQSAFFDGDDSVVVLADDVANLRTGLPSREMTVAAWVSVDRPEQWGGIMGAIQDNGDAEQGWVLGYNESVFTFAVSTQGADDGDGQMTYLAGQTRYVPGQFYHVVGVYDGQTMSLYVNDRLEATSDAQSGDILYPQHAPWVIGAYRDANEFYPLRGRIREVALYDLAAKPKWVEQEFQHQQRLTTLPAVSPTVPLKLVVKPFLQYGTTTGMTVVWQTSVPTRGRLRWGETAECEHVIENQDMATIHTLRIEDLEPETQYFYCVESETIAKESDGEEATEGLEGVESVRSEVSTFQTAARPETPFAFAVISDTQGNPAVSGKFAQMAWDQRPNFVLHPGDLVDTGTNDRQWTHEFFASMDPLISRVPLFPVLGNHERNAQNYFDYMALPEPEYYYTFRYGNTDFFMIDTNRKVDPDSEQYQWLDRALGESTATWKIVCHHHPPYSSDENDYGDLWKTNRGTRGDLRVRQLVELYDRHGVDIVWTGHIHSYERTWPVRNSRAVNQNGTVYMITGGGGGVLETAGPYRPWFQNNVRHGHHYCMVHVNGTRIEIRSFDLEGRLFDTVALEKAK